MKLTRLTIIILFAVTVCTQQPQPEKATGILKRADCFFGESAGQSNPIMEKNPSGKTAQDHTQIMPAGSGQYALRMPELN